MKTWRMLFPMGLIAIMIFGNTLISDSRAKDVINQLGIIKAEEFRVVDDEGDTRISLGLWKGAPRIVLYGKGSEQASVIISAHDGNPCIAVADKQGEAAISMGIENFDCPVFRIYNGSEERTRIWLGLDQTKSPRLWVGDSGVKAGTHIGLDGNSPFIRLHDKTGELVWKANIPVENHEGNTPHVPK